MNSLPVPPGGDQDRSASELAVYWTEVPIAIIVVALRLYSRSKIKAIGADDWVMVVTLLLFIAASVAATFMVAHGGARHLYYLDPAQVEYTTKTAWICQPFNIISLASGRISVALLILRLLGPSTFWQKWFLYVSMLLNFVLNGLTSIFTFVQCNPARALWEGPAKFPHAKCWNPSTQLNFSLFSGSYNAIVDLCLALLPITIVYGLNLALQKKIALATLLSVGIFASVCAAIKVSKLPELTARSDFTWATYNLFIWATTEDFILILCGSIPTLKPLYDDITLSSLLPTLFTTGKFSSGTPSSKTAAYYGSSSAQKRSQRRMYLDPHYAASRVDSQEQQPLGAGTNRVLEEGRKDGGARVDENEVSWLEMGSR